jgi:hypothetical protein
VRESKNRAVLRVEAVEPRRLPSGLPPALPAHTFQSVVAAVERVGADLARTHNVARAAVSLARISREIPFGLRQLDPAWEAELTRYNPAVPGSALTTTADLLTDLNRDVGTEVAAGEFRLTGPGARALANALGIQASRDSVIISNATGFSLTVSAVLGGSRTSGPVTIGNGGTHRFDFGSNTNNFIAINVSRAGGGPAPPPLVNYGLGRPIDGYNGKTFGVGVFNGVYTVRQ